MHTPLLAHSQIPDGDSSRWSFYDRQHASFGKYGSSLHSDAHYPDGNPEDHFRELVIGLGGPDRWALDIGSGSGGFTLESAPHYAQLVGIEPSNLILTALEQKRARSAGNVHFCPQDGHAAAFAGNSFDVIYSRRGPNPRAEVDRLLKPGGHFAWITIGYDDLRELKQAFGRGQFFGRTGDVCRWNADNLEQRGYTVCEARDYRYATYYADLDRVDQFLHRAPIFEDYGLPGDRDCLKRYVAKNTTPRGIELRHHRVILHGVRS